MTNKIHHLKSYLISNIKNDEIIFKHIEKILLIIVILIILSIVGIFYYYKTNIETKKK